MRNKSSSQTTLKEKRKQWLEVLSGEDPHSIFQQIAGMTEDAASFLIINEARRLAPPAPDGGVQLNGLIHDLIDRGFYCCQLSAIRRLSDKAPLKGEKGVYSLISLINDMDHHHPLFTREAIFEAEGLEYDPEVIRTKQEKYRAEKKKSGETVSFLPDELSLEETVRRHKQIDYLAKVYPNDRKPDDLIDKNFLPSIKYKVLSACKDIINIVNKYIAHASTPQSRKVVKVNDVTLNDIRNSHRHICEAVSFISIYILGEYTSYAFLPASLPEQLTYLERPLIEESNFIEIDKVCDHLKIEYLGYNGWKPDN
ncbi:MAG TPA: hypothetical protein VMG59_00145 [Phycisphaerae bacterium]|nr:hypothetical protein [Phycisphaerae bacterium]